MSNELFVIIGTCLISYGVFSANPMFPAMNRPTLFRGNWGEPFFAALALIIMLSAISMGIWSFIKVTWYVNITLIIGAVNIFTFFYQYFPLTLKESALSPIIASIGLVALHYLLWS